MDSVITERDVKIVNPLGMHARPAALFVKLATTFASEIEVGNDSMMVNGKSIMGVMMLAAEQGSTIKIRATGSDSPQAVDGLAELVGKGFGES